jgi:hypothetical protein
MIRMVVIAVVEIAEAIEGSEPVEFLNYATSKTKEAAQPGRLLGESFGRLGGSA